MLDVNELYTSYTNVYSNLEKMYQQHSCLQRNAESFALNSAKNETVHLLAKEWLECQKVNL